MIFKSNFPDIDFKKIGNYGIYQFIISKFNTNKSYGIYRFIRFIIIIISKFITNKSYGINDDKAIFIDGITDKILSFGQLKTNSKKLAFGLINKVGFKRGDVLAIYSPNHVSINNYP
jgi:hypothetical protein